MMSDLFGILPMAIMYLASGFTFLCGFYLLIDKRFDFMSDISFSIMLVLGFLIDTAVAAIPYDFGFRNVYLRNLVLVMFSFLGGVAVAFVRNSMGDKINNFVIRNGRRKTSSESFWYDILDAKDRPIWIRLTNIEKNYILDGVLLSLAESMDNPYLRLGYCTKYDLKGDPIVIENVNAKDKYVQKIVRPDAFDEITIFYADGSSKGAEVNIDNRGKENGTG